MPFHFKGVFSFFLMATRKALAVLPSASPILRSFTEIQNCRQKKALDKVTALASTQRCCCRPPEEQYSPLFSARPKKYPMPPCPSARLFKALTAARWRPTYTRERATHTRAGGGNRIQSFAATKFQRCCEQINNLKSPLWLRHGSESEMMSTLVYCFSVFVEQLNNSLFTLRKILIFRLFYWPSSIKSQTS